MMKSNFKEFFIEFKKQTEQQWENIVSNEDIWGYQIQKGTKWLDGHSSKEIESLLNYFQISKDETHEDLMQLLLLTTGLDLVQVSIKPNNKKPTYQQGWKLNLDYIETEFRRQKEEMKARGELNALANIVMEEYTVIPIFAHRCIVITKKDLKVYSIYGEDIIVYGNNLQEYLKREFLNN